MTNHKAALGIFFLAALLLASFASAEILANTATDKNTLSTNEVAGLKIKLFNDANAEVKNVMVRVQSDGGITFVENGEEKNTVIMSIDSIPGGTGKETVQEIKGATTAKPSATIYVYYGTGSNPTNASVTTLSTKELPITLAADMKKQTYNGNDSLVVNFKLTNNSKETLSKASAEIIAPSSFTVTTAPIMVDTLAPGASIERQFEVVAPLEATGKQNLVLAYGFFDAAGPHYFEKQFTADLQKPNYTLIILVGIAVFIVAGYLLLRKGGKGTDVKGTEQKDKWEKEAKTKK